MPRQIRPYLEALAGRFIEPDGITSHQRKSRILSAILLGLSAALLGSICVHLLVAPDRYVSEMLIGALAIAINLALYRLNRAGHFQASLILLIVHVLSGISAVILLEAPDPFLLMSLIGFLNLAVLFSSALMPLRWTLVVAAADLTVTTALVLLTGSNQPGYVLLGIFRFNIVMALAILAVAVIRQYEQQQLERQAEKLRAREAHYRNLFEAISDPICVCENDLLIDVNPAFEQMFARDRADIIGLSARTLLAQESRELADTTASQSDLKRYETDIVRRDGIVVAVEISSHSYDHDGHTFRVMVLRDVRDRKQAEQALVEERNLLSTVIENIPEQFYVKDREHRFIIANQAVHERWGKNVIGLTDDDLLPAQWAAMARANEEKIFETGEATFRPDFDEQMLAPDGSGQPRWLSIAKVPLRDGTGQIKGLVGINRDVTSLKQAEMALREERNLLRAVIDAVPDLIYVKDAAHRLILANRATQERWGMPDIIGKNDFDLTTREEAESLWQQEEALLQEQQTLLTYEVDTTRADGQAVSFVVSKVPLRDSEGRVVGVVGTNRVITQQKIVERALERERNLLRAIIDAVPDHIYVKDRDHRFILANRATEMYWERNDLIGKTDDDLMPDDSAATHWGDEEAVLRDGQPLINREATMPNDRGRFFSIMINKVPLRDAEGRIVGLVGVNRDVSHQKLIERDLEIERNLLRSVIDAVPDLIYVKDADHRFILVNRAVEAHWGSTDLIGKTDDDLIPPDSARALWSEEEDLLQGRQSSVMLEFEYIGAEARPVTYLINKVPLRDSEGRVAGIVGVNRDITERKQFEEQLRYHANLMDNASDAVISTDMNLTIVSWNRGAEQMYGWRAEEVIGKSLQEVLTTQVTDEQRAAAFQDVLQNGRWEGEVIQTHRDGSFLHIHNVGTLIRDHLGNPVGLVAINRDITAKKQIEQQRMELAVERERVKILQQVISDMSHDIKNPLANFRTSLYLLEKFIEQPTRRQEYLDSLDTHTARLETMLDDLLSISRLEQATDEFSFEPVDIAPLMKEIVSHQQTLAVRRQQHLECADPGALPVIQADRAKLSRAITNLVVNALNYTPEAGTIQVSAHTKDQTLVIDVRDNGIGIPPEELDYIFERFYRVDKARSSATGGSGLGLSIARRIVEAHGGTIQVESTPGEGSLFSIHLPISG